MSKGVYPGSFDPVTLGHLDIIERASKLVDTLVVAILENPNKRCLLTVEERKEHLKMVTAHLPNVEIASFRGLMAEFGISIGANVIIRGLRNVGDFQMEAQMAHINHALEPRLETIFIPACQEHGALSSTAVKEVLTFSSKIDFMVPAQVKDLVVQKYQERNKN